MAEGRSIVQKEWKTQLYHEQEDHIWPKEGNHILAQYDEETVVVYQAYCPDIAQYAVRNQVYVTLEVST